MQMADLTCQIIHAALRPASLAARNTHVRGRHIALEDAIGNFVWLDAGALNNHFRQAFQNSLQMDDKKSQHRPETAGTFATGHDRIIIY